MWNCARRIGTTGTMIFLFAPSTSKRTSVPNAHSHCQHLLLNASESVPVLDGKLMLGRWQRLFLVELDRPRPRNIVVSFIGARG